MTTVSITTEGGRPIEALADLIEKRMKMMGQTPEQAVSSSAIQILKSLRATTKTASPNRTRIEVQTVGTLHPSFTSRGKKKIPCLRFGKNRYIPPKGTTILFKNFKRPTDNVFKWVYLPPNTRKGHTYLIVANGQATAIKEARNIVKKRAKRFKGLAKRAIIKLMHKACSFNVADNVSSLVDNVSDINTSANKFKRQSKVGSVYRLELDDKLIYATLALKNGEADIENSIKNAANKIASIINHKCKNLLGFEKVDIPFPK